MKKIDLHIHSIKTKKDTSNRDISSEKFVKIMNSSNVGIAAITNHNYFDNTQYSEIQNILREKRISDLIVLPGLEVDVYLNNSPRKQMNMIFSNDNENEFADFKNFYNFFESKFNDINDEKKDLKALNIEEILEYFKNNENFKTILYLDAKKQNKNSTGFSNDEIKIIYNIFDNLKNVTIVLDFNSEDKFNFFFKHNKEDNVLIGSDNLNWEDYENKSEKLLKYSNYIRNFSDLFGVLKNKETFDTFNKFKLIANIDNLELKINQDKTQSKDKESSVRIKNVKLVKKAFNVIFGPKSSGKTQLLKAIYDHTNKNIKSKYYEPKDERLWFEFKDYNNKIVEDFLNKETNEFYKCLDNITIYEKKSSKISNLYDYIKQNNPFKLLEAKNSYYENNLNEIKTSTEEILNKINDLIKLIDKNKKYYTDINQDELLILKNLKTFFLKNWINNYKLIFFWKINSKIPKGFTNILGTLHKTTFKDGIGLKSKFDDFLNIHKFAKEFQNKYINRKIEKEIGEYDIPSDKNQSKKVSLFCSLKFKFNEQKKQI